MWALIDNYDSFTHILHHYLLEEHDDVRIWRNDEISVEALSDLRPERIIISPGPHDQVPGLSDHRSYPGPGKQSWQTAILSRSLKKAGEPKAQYAYK